MATGRVLLIVAACAITLTSCESARYVKSELSGTARPAGGILENVPVSKSYSAAAQEVRRAVLAVLDDQGYIYDENASAGTVRSEPRLLTDTSKLQIAGAYYYARLYIKIDGASVSFRAKFDKKSNVTMAEQNVDYPEKENELRRDFFLALDKRLSRPTVQRPVAAPVASSATPVETSTPAGMPKGMHDTQMSTAEMQTMLSQLGYQPGPADGVSGKRTIDALKKFQVANGLSATGVLDSETANRLRAAVRRN